MKYTPYPERLTTFERTIAALKMIHGRCRLRSPWQNGIVERSHRTDNEELFHCLRFVDSEDRRYQLKLWEYEYNTRRPHQGLGGRPPMDVYLSDYRLHATTRMLT
jgi:transposase InsO family protein